MKTMKLLCLFLIALLPLLSFKPRGGDDGYYAFIVVDGVWKNHTGYASSIIYYPGYSECNKYRDIDFFSEARRSFSSYLQAYYSDAFPTGENNNFYTVDTKRFSTSELLKTRTAAEQRLTEWIAEQKGKGYRVVTTRFGFSCENLK